MTNLLQETSLAQKVHILPELKNQFVDWQSRLNASIAAFPGFISLEVHAISDTEWLIIQRFQTSDQRDQWKNSSAFKQLMSQLKPLLVEGTSFDNGMQEEFKQFGVTEVFVTRISKEKEDQYREWLRKIHEVEARFPGFKGMYVQAPKEGENWITFLQFDTVEHLDHWLQSPERAAVLAESNQLIRSLESHRVISPYAGWFASIIQQTGEAPPAWKQSMVTLLVLFPIVMFELKFLSPFLSGLNFNMPVSTFISNAISVMLIAWPMMPIAIAGLRWWLLPAKRRQWLRTLFGTLLITALYLAEIVFFWKFF